MTPKLILLILFGACVLAGKPPETTPKAVRGSHSNFTYGYSLHGKNDAHQEQIQHRNGKHVQGSFAVHLPDGQSVSDVEYTADENGFHPVVRLSTKTNHSQVTSHFALGQSAVKRLGEQNERSSESTSESKDSPSVTALIAKYGEKDSDGFDPKKTNRGSIQKPPIKYDAKSADDTISQVLSSLFPDGIPSKYEELLNTTDDLKFDVKTDYPLPAIYTSETSEEEDITTTPFIMPTEETKVRRELNSERYEDVKRFPSKVKENIYEHLVSDEEVLQINDAAENYTEEDEAGTQMLPTVEQVTLYELRPDEQRGGFGDLHPFEAPIVVEEQNDNLFASSSGNTENFVFPPSKEIRIIPSRERYVSGRNYGPGRRINLKILDGDNGFKQAILKAATAQDLDAFQKIVEENFSHSPEYKTEAPSRAFLRGLDQKYVKYTYPPSSEDKYLKQENRQKYDESAQLLLEKYKKERKYEDSSVESAEKDKDEQRYEDGKTHLVPKYENKPNKYKNTMRSSIEVADIESRSGKEDTQNGEHSREIPKQLFTPNQRDDNDEDSISSPALALISERPREKTFVEIAKAVNIQNLLIKEDEDSIERHEEYLQPLAFGDRLTHRIESKFMKSKPWQQYQPHPVSENQITLIPVNIRPSISYALPPEHIEYHPPEYYNVQQYDHVQQNPQDHHQFQGNDQDQHNEQQIRMQSEDPNNNFNEDPEEKDVEESRHVSKLHTSVNFNNIENSPSKLKPEPHTLHQSVATPVIPRYFPGPVVEKIVEKHVKVPFPVKEYVEKIIEKPVKIEKFIDRPVPYFVAVDRIVETPIHVPYPVEHFIAVEHPIPVEVEKFVDRPVHIPVEKIVNRPYPVEKIVEKIVDRPIPVHIPVKVPVPVHVPVKISVPNTYFSSQPTASSIQQQPYIAPGKKDALQEFQKALESAYTQPVTVHQQISDEINTMLKKQQLWNKNQMPIHRNPKQIPQHDFQNGGYGRDDYYGPVPLQSEHSHWGGQHFKRSSDFGRNLRMEYGFKPPLIPSIEIDDQGMPVNRKTDS